MSQKGMYRFKLFYFLVYVSFTTHHFLNIYFREIGLTGFEIGVIKALSAVVMVFSQPILGMLCDLLKMRNGLLNALLFTAGLTFLTVSFFDSFPLILLMIVAYSFFKSPIVPIADSIVMLEVAGDGSKYSQVRLWGAVGFSTSVVWMGYFFNRFLENLFLVYFIFSILALGVAFLLPGKNSYIQKGKLKLKDFSKLFSHKGFMYFLLGIILLQSGAFMIDGFFGLFVKERIGNEITLGWALTLAGLSEIFVYRYLGRLKSTFSARNLLIISGVVSAVRWFLYARSTVIIQILLLQLLHGFTFGFFYIAAVTYINNLLPVEFATSGQTLLWASAFGLSSVIGSILGGTIYDQFDYNWIFLTATILAISSVVVFFLFTQNNK